MSIIQTNFPAALQLNSSYQGKVFANSSDINTVGSNTSFEDILTKKTNESGNLVRFSKHASARLEQRNIELSESQLERLEEGTRKALGKGINESLIMVDQLAFIVNIPNSTVITAMDQTESNENIFTNIDGAVIV